MGRTGIRFECERRLEVPPVEICAGIADVGRWSDFRGFGPIPGIRSATYVTRTSELVGSVIRVSNRDGSSHTERILEWRDGERVVLELGEFSRPLALLAERFVETWTFDTGPDGPRARRAFELYPRSALSRPLVYFVSLLLRAAIDRHLAQVAGATRP